MGMSLTRRGSGSLTYLAPLRILLSTSRGTAVKPCSRIAASMAASLEDITRNALAKI